MLKIVIPMGGEGKNFLDRGFVFPKPLVEVQGRPMIHWVVKNLELKEPHQFIFVCQEAHLHRFALGEVLSLIAPGSVVIPLRQGTAGALCSVLLAAEYLADGSELIVANADQVVDVPLASFLAEARKPDVDGCIMTFPSTHPKWSFAKVVDGEVVAVAEKRPISQDATAGLYYFRKAKTFLECAEQMILKNAAIQGQFFVAPVYNELILGGQRVTTFPIERAAMHSLGSPEDVESFIAQTPFDPSW
jgi:NDP-sugar pyrophosphorylase family protein